MSMAVDQSLDDIITSKKQSRKPSGGARRGAGGARAGATAAAAGGQTSQQRVPAKARQQHGPVASPIPGMFTSPAIGGVIGDTVVISNLPDDVKEEDIRNLFHGQVGPVKFAHLLTEGPRNKSRGMAIIQFRQASHATTAFKKYNGILMDGRLKLSVGIVFNPDSLPPPPLSQRLSAPPAPAAPVSAVVAAAGGAARQGRQAGAARRNKRTPGGADRGPKPTLESLDAEMADYQAQASAANGPTA